MNRRRITLALQLAAGLVFAGLGHYYLAVLRPVYPADGFIFYVAAVVCWGFAWRALQREADPMWATLRDSVHAAWGVIVDALRLIASTLRDLLPLMSTRTLTAFVMGLNVIAAIIALVLPAALSVSLAVWVVSAAWAIWYALRRSDVWTHTGAPPPAPVAAELPAWTEPIETGERRTNLIALAVAVMLIVAGTLAINVTSQSGTPSPSIGASIDAALKLDLLDPAKMLGGWLLLIAGTIAFGFVTRRMALSGCLRSVFDAPGRPQRHMANYWLVAAIVAIVLWLGAISSIVNGATGWGGVLPWLTAIVLMAACWWAIDRSRGVRLKIGLDRIEAVALIAAFAGVLIVFAFRLGDIPIGIWGDEGAFFVTARDIAHGAFTPDAFGPGTYSFPVAASIYQAIWIGLFGHSVVAWRLGSAVIAAAAIVPLYFLVRSTLGRRVAWTSIALYAVSPYILTYARLGYINSQALLPVVLALALTWLAMRRNSRLYAFLAGGASGLAFFTHPSARIVIVLVPIWLIWIWFRRVVQTRSIALQGTVMLLGVIIVAAPSVVYGLSRAPAAFATKLVDSSFNNVFYARDLFPENDLYSQVGAFQVGDQQLFYEPGIYATLLARGAIRTALSFHTPTIVRENFLTGALADPFGLVFVLGLGWCLARWRRPAIAIYPAWLLIGGFVTSGLSAFPPRPSLMLPIAPAMIVMSAVGVISAIDLLSSVVGGVPERARVIGAIGLVIVFGFIGWRTYFVDMPARFPPDLDNAITWHAQQMKPGTDVTLIQPDGTSDDYVPWGIREFQLNVNFHLIKPAALAATDPISVCPNGCRIFFVAANYYQVLSWLTPVIGDQKPVSLLDEFGNAQAWVFINDQAR